MKKNLFPVIAIAFSLIAIGIAVWHVTPFETNDTYIGAIATLIGVFVTLHIGFQIYNGLELRKEVAKQTRVFRIEIAKQKRKSEELDRKSEELKNLIDKQKKAIENQHYKMQEYRWTAWATSVYIEKSPTHGINAFSYMHCALVWSLRANTTDFDWMFESLNIYINNIDPTHFADRETEQLAAIAEADKKIRGHDNFKLIESRYNEVMTSFRKAINKSSKSQL